MKMISKPQVLKILVVVSMFVVVGVSAVNGEGFAVLPAKVEIRAMFGPGSEGPARGWSDIENKSEVRLANKIVAGESLSDADKKEIAGSIEQWRKERMKVEAVAARGRSLAPVQFISPVLKNMLEGEKNVVGGIDVAHRAW